MKTINFAILGVGRIGSRHAEKLQSVNGARLVAVCDTNSERAEEVGNKYGCIFYTKLEDLLNDKNVDIVNVCTPSGAHPEHSIACLKAGKHVLCEKPMALNESDAEEMVKTAQQNKKQLFVVKQNRYNAPVKLIEEMFNNGKLGKPILCTVDMIWNRNDEYYKNDAWRGTLALDGGTIYTQASHFVDLMLFFLGKPKLIFSFMGTKNHKIEIEDTGVVATEFENGSLGSLNYTTCATKKNFEGSITLVCSKGTVKIGGEYLNKIEYFQVDGIDSYVLEDSDAGANDYGTYKGSMSNHDKVFIDVVAKLNGLKESGKLVFGETAVDTVRFMEKAIESAKTGKAVHF